jgi:hypothetical protein
LTYLDLSDLNPVEARATTEALDPVCPPDPREKGLEWVLAANLETARTYQREPLAVMNGLSGASLLSENLDRYFAQPTTVELLVKALEAKLGAAIGELLYFPQKALLPRELLLDLVEHLAVDFGAAAKLVDAGNQSSPLGLQGSITELGNVAAALRLHGVNPTSQFG